MRNTDKYAGIIEIEVSSATELSDNQLDSLRTALEAKTGKEVKLKVKQDQSLRGGIAVRIEDTVIDGTIKHKLEQLSESLMSTKAAE
ncbi:MAG: ATP synthase F1 subunit delta [Balneolaceae bacterium]|nr:ATP synthase F1 subunit delta [Balneolaceae bacterium]